MNEELKPVNCGCGGIPVVGHIEASNRWYIGCPDCDICTGLYNTEIEVIKAWNMAMGERTAKVKYIVHTHGYPDEGLCGNCNEDVNGLYDYCPSCGAKLDWSENE